MSEAASSGDCAEADCQNGLEENDDCLPDLDDTPVIIDEDVIEYAHLKDVILDVQLLSCCIEHAFNTSSRFTRAAISRKAR